jgi:4,5-DOPA dioxygenase extradiol
MSPQGHYDLAKGLTALRRKGVLIMGSGNMVHNLRRIALPAGSTTGFNTRFGLDWALEANALMKSLIDSGQHDKLADYQSLGSAVRLAVPTPEHYLPLLYALALKEDADALSYFNDYALAGSLTMTSLIIDRSV